VDTFYAPARDRRGEQAIQQGISDINQVLNERFVEHRADQRESQFQEGVADAIREQAGEELQGVQTGTIFHQNSRFYMAGLNETRGRAAAQEFQRATQQAWEEWEDRDNDEDGTLFREWMNGRLAEFTNTLGNDRHRLAGALPTAQQVANNMAARHASYTSRRIAAANAAATRQVHSGIWTNAIAGENGGSPEALQAAFLEANGVTEDHFDVDGVVANRTALEGLIDASNFANDPTALEWVESGVRSGQIRMPVDDAARLSNAIESVRSDRTAEENRINAQLEAEQEAANQQALLDTFAQAQADPFGMSIPSLDDFGGDFTTWNRAITIQNTFQNAATETDPMMDFGAQLQFTAAVTEAPDLGTAIQAAGNLVLDMGPGYASMGSQFVQDTIEMAQAENLIRNPLVANAREPYVNHIGDFDDAEFTSEQLTPLRTRGQYLFNRAISKLAAPGEITPPHLMHPI